MLWALYMKSIVLGILLLFVLIIKPLFYLYWTNWTLFSTLLSLEYARVLDKLKAERERGITIDILLHRHWCSETLWLHQEHDHSYTHLPRLLRPSSPSRSTSSAYPAGAGSGPFPVLATKPATARRLSSNARGTGWILFFNPLLV
jgi:hypothetical protein